jgi:hypothetical protein
MGRNRTRDPRVPEPKRTPLGRRDSLLTVNFCMCYNKYCLKNKSVDVPWAAVGLGKVCKSMLG